MALTKKQREIVLLLYDGHVIRGHRRPDNRFCYRLLTADYRPLRNINPGIVNTCINRDYVKKTMQGLQLTDHIRVSKARRVYYREEIKDNG